VSDLLIDAPLLACPHPEHFTDQEFQSVFTDYLARLSDLTMIRACCKSVRFWRDEELSSVLHEQNCYPFRHSLALALGHLFDPLEFQTEDINVLATALLERSVTLEESGDIKDIVVSDCSLVGDPVRDRLPIFLNHVCRVIALALPVLGDGKELRPNTYIASCGKQDSAEHVSASFTVEIAEGAEGPFEFADPLISVDVPNFRGALPMFEDADFTTWWAIATEAAVLDVCAIRAGIGEADPWVKIGAVRRQLTVGDDFISSASRLGFMHDATKIQRLLRVCDDLMVARNLADSHWLRVGKGSNESQRTRGEWRAWRHDIDHEFHLHYWTLGDRIELANVVVHNDFQISS
jgi:hypothetical protein